MKPDGKARSLTGDGAKSADGAADRAADGDEVAFLPEDEEFGEGAISGEAGWPILVLDDDPDVHVATRLALQNCHILGRTLQLYSAYSADEARSLLRSSGPFACVLLDVVMESEDAGLQLVDYIRNEIGDQAVRIILRTGHPGYAPETEVVSQYDINDYRAKSELTRNKLITTLTSAIRSYDSIRTIEENQARLARVVDLAPELFRHHRLQPFCQEVLWHLCSLLTTRESGLLCFEDDQSGQGLRALAALGAYESFLENWDPWSSPGALGEHFTQALRERQSCFADDQIVLYMEPATGQRLVILLDVVQPPGNFERRLVELFSVNISVGFDNARMFEYIEDLAYRDENTGLPNRAGFVHELREVLAEPTAWQVLIADIDGFQEVNDGLGRSLGDQVLVSLAVVLREFFGPEVLLGRLSGDSFVIAAQGWREEEITQRFRELNDSLRRGISLGPYTIPLTMTFGVAWYPEHGRSPETLLQNASIALKRAKARSRTWWQVFSSDFDRELVERLELLRDLSSCLEQDRLALYFQPQLSLEGGHVTGLEALVRWNREGYGWVLPGVFIPAAEDAGLIVSIGRWVLEEACRKQRVIVQETGTNLPVAVNISMRQMKDPEFLGHLDDILFRTEINPEFLELEITESIMIEDFESVRRLLEAFRKRGIRVSIDDFGTGYSSLSYLQNLPVDRLKIDRNFVSKLGEDSSSHVIPALVVEMSHMLRLGVAAEGVETPDQEGELRSLGCDEVQGVQV